MTTEEILSKTSEIKDATLHAHELVNKTPEIMKSLANKELSELDPKDLKNALNDLKAEYYKAHDDAVESLIDVLRIMNSSSELDSDLDVIIDITTKHVNNLLVALSDNKKDFDRLSNQLIAINQLDSILGDMLTSLKK